ncbi:Xylose isomerase domain-containing protein TIM barrel [Actinobacteria bacterium OK074]|nr:Xylose isomerase domain-containing protein TIM barrel [Actinobacteria bacterium OK074]
MRPCVLTDEISQDLDEVLAVCVRHGFPAIEVRSVWNTPPHELTPRQCKEIAARTADAGLTVAGFASPVFKTELPTGTRDLDRSTELLSRSLEQCAVLGAGLVRVFSYFRAAQPDVAAAAHAVGAVLDRVATDGVTVAFESGTRTNTPTAALTQQLLDLLDRPDTGLLWDPGNTVFSGFGDGTGTAGLADIRPGSLAHVHVKDPQGTREYVELGHGTLSWPTIVAALRERGYTGHLSLETHWRPGRVLTAKERDEPWGDGFSAGGVHASEPCMATLAAWLKEPA